MSEEAKGIGKKIGGGDEACSGGGGGGGGRRISPEDYTHKLRGYLQVKHNPQNASGKSRSRLLTKVSSNRGRGEKAARRILCFTAERVIHTVAYSTIGLLHNMRVYAHPGSCTYIGSIRFELTYILAIIQYT